jgi:hypothetical protein
LGGVGQVFGDVSDGGFKVTVDSAHVRSGQSLCELIIADRNLRKEGADHSRLVMDSPALNGLKLNSRKKRDLGPWVVALLP